ncbi:MAG: hypothetical protein Kow0059_21920 [Candidatus Sumerlaeia bacterium]
MRITSPISRWSISLRALIVGTLILGGAGVCRAADPVHIYGIHDWGAGASGLFNGRTRWDVEVIRVGIDSPNLQQIRDDGFGLIVRLGKQWGESVPKNSSEWAGFAASCAATVSTYSSITNKWIIGNEMNADFDSNIPPSSYITIYTQCRNAIKTVQMDAQVLVAAVAPWNSAQNPGGPYPHAWLNYMKALVDGLGANCDGFAIHAYGGRGGDSDPRDDNYWGFGVYKDWMNIIGGNPATASKPVYLTEMNPFADGWGPTPGYPKYSYPAGWIQKAYEEINNWNAAHTQKIRAACWFAYSNGGFPGYDLTLLPQAAGDFSATTAGTNYIYPPSGLPWAEWAMY